LTEVRESSGRRHQSLLWVKWVAGGLLLALAVAAVAAEIALRRVEPYLRERIVEELENRFHARVELDSFQLSLLDGLSAEGKGVRIWLPKQAEGAALSQGDPLIRLNEFCFHAPLAWRPHQPIRVSVVALKGLSIHLPPRAQFERLSAGSAGSNPTPATETTTSRGWGTQLVSFDVETLECTNAELVIETDKPGKLPLVFEIARIKLTNIAAGGAIHLKDEDLALGASVIGFDAELTNPRPKGTIYTTGSFGPLNTADLGAAALQGDYRLKKADLASFKEIAGTLDSTGHYAGTLRDLTVDGETETPDFRLTHFGNALPLSTRFHARVDGTNGDTWLEPVDATLGCSHFTATGQIVRVPEDGDQQYGHDIALNVNVDRARIEDFLRLAGRTNNVLLTGDVRVKTTLHIPPGTPPMHERLQLNGWFALNNALFTSEKIQGRIAELSLRGQGRPDDLKTTDPASILSRVQGNFQMAGGVVTLPALDYTVPGAQIQLKGSYGVEGGALNFDGTAKMEATVSKMLGGWKGLLLSPADRYFKKDGAGTEVGIFT